MGSIAPMLPGAAGILGRVSRSLLGLAIALAVVLAGCEPGATSVAPGSPTPASTTAVVTTASPTPPALPEKPPRERGSPSVTCVDGWVTPEEGSPRFSQPLGIVRRTTGIEGPLVVVDMRYFTGPESPSYLSSGEQAKGYLAVVERWYIKLYAEEDLSFQGRFLVESRRFGRGLSAVAPYDTEGWASPDWRGFQYDSSHPTRMAVRGLPATWSGVEYDFVRGGAGLEIPGLPEEVVGCLRGT